MDFTDLYTVVIRMQLIVHLLICSQNNMQVFYGLLIKCLDSLSLNVLEDISAINHFVLLYITMAFGMGLLPLQFHGLPGKSTH